MRRRILRAILLAVAVTACALGIPLAYSAVIVVQSTKSDTFQATAQNAAAEVDTQLADTGQETNGLVFEDRRPKAPIEQLRAIFGA